MKIFTIGNGFVSDHLNYNKIIHRLAFDYQQINNVLDLYKPDVLINCIGKTGRPNIDWCENNKSITAMTNTALPILLAEVCNKKSIHLIQIGSGCIFTQCPNSDGWRETDLATPPSFYSRTKYACDLILGEMKNVTTLRIRMPISTKVNNRNLINKLRGYSQIINEPNSVTFMTDLEDCVKWFINNGKTGIYHTTNPGTLSAVEIMREYQNYVPEHKFDIITVEQLEKLTLAKRSNCILNTEKLNNAGFYMKPAKEALKDCMKDYIKNLKLENSWQTKI